MLFVSFSSEYDRLKSGLTMFAGKIMKCDASVRKDGFDAKSTLVA